METKCTGGDVWRNSESTSQSMRRSVRQRCKHMFPILVNYYSIMTRWQLFEICLSMYSDLWITLDVLCVMTLKSEEVGADLLGGLNPLLAASLLNPLSLFGFSLRRFRVATLRMCRQREAANQRVLETWPDLIRKSYVKARRAWKGRSTGWMRRVNRLWMT